MRLFVNAVVSWLHVWFTSVQRFWWINMYVCKFKTHRQEFRSDRWRCNTCKYWFLEQPASPSMLIVASSNLKRIVRSQLNFVNLLMCIGFVFNVMHYIIIHNISIVLCLQLKRHNRISPFINSAKSELKKIGRSE